MAKTAITLEQFDDWKKANARLVEMQLDLRALEEEATDILLKIGTAENFGRDDRLTVEAMALVSGDRKAKLLDAGTLRTELGKINHKKNVLRRAIEIQRNTVERLRYKHSAELCKELTPQYKGLVRDVARAAVSLAKAMQKERQFRDDLLQADISYTGYLPPVVFKGVGYLDDPDSTINYFLDEAERFGYILKEGVM
jgi:hypothetical protein